jgi:CHASE3 domain sensor protein
MIRPRIHHFAGAPLLLVALLAVAVHGVVAYRTSVNLHQSTEEAEQALRLAERTNFLLSILKDAETGQRGYLITSRKEYLQPYKTAVQQIPGILNSLGTAPGLSANQLSKLADLRSVIKNKMAELQRTVELQEAGNKAAAIDMVLTGAGRADMLKIRALSSEISAESEHRLMEEAESRRHQSRIFSGLTITGGSVLFLILLASAIAIEGGSRRRDQLIGELKRNQDFLSNFVKHVPAAVAMLDRKMRYVHASDRWCSDYHLEGTD